MLDKFAKSLGFLGVNASNMNKKEHEKFMFVFEDEIVNKHWLSFFATYHNGRKQGRIDVLNEISIHCIKLIDQ